MADVMSGMVLTGHGGPEKLEWRDDLPVPTPAAGEVLIEVASSSVNNTDINTRIGWYSENVRGATDAVEETSDGDASWAGVPLGLPRVQGADVCGRIVGVGEGVSAARISERVLVRTMQSRDGATWTMGSECDGAFAQFCTARSHDALAVNCDWSDLELGTLPCAYSTAEGMLQRASVKQGDRVLITGASGGVGAAAVQLAKLRGAHVTAVTSASKGQALLDLGADAVIERDDMPTRGGFDVLVDLVAGPAFVPMLDGLANFGRYVCSGAIAGPIVELDVRKLYLRDLSFFGSTHQPDNIMKDLIGYVEAGHLKPAIAATFSARDLHAAQAVFAEKTHVGKIAVDVAGAMPRQTEDTVFTECAGTVLLWPYIEPLFLRFGIEVGEGALQASDLPLAASALLYASGSEGPLQPVHYMLLGIDAQTPLQTHILTQEQEKTIHELLRAVTEHWTALADTSIESLQQTFLLRSGKLRRTEQAYELTLERDPFDMLLDQMPYPISHIKFKWMPDLCSVHWASAT